MNTFRLVALVAVGAIVGWTAAQVVLQQGNENRGAAGLNTPAGVAGDARLITSLTDLLEIPGAFERRAAVYRLALQADQQQVLVLLQQALTLPEAVAASASRILYGRFAELDADGAMQHMLDSAFADDPVWLAAVLADWPAGTDTALAGVGLSERGQLAGALRLQSADSLTPLQREPTATAEVLAAATAAAGQISNPEQSWNSALLRTNQQDRMRELMKIAHAWARTDPRAALAATEGLTDLRVRRMLAPSIVQTWAQSEPDQAVEWALAQPPNSARRTMLAAAAGGVAQQDPHKAMALVQQLPQEDQQQSMTAALSVWAARDPRAAAQWSRQLLSSEDRARVTTTLARAYAQIDPQEARAWARSLDTNEAGKALLHVTQVIAANDPERASAVLDDIEEPGSWRNAARAVARSWGESDPAEAARWIGSLDQDDERPGLYQQLMRRWSNYDRDGAVSHINTINNERERDHAIIGVLSGLQGDVELAESLYNEVTTPESRRIAAQRMYYVLRNSDPERAEQYRREAGIRPRSGT